MRDEFIQSQGGEPHHFMHNLWYKNIPDDLAWETMFGLIGGDPEYTELYLTYIPEMLRYLNSRESAEVVLDDMADQASEVGNEEWEKWVEPTLTEAFTEAERVVKQYSKEAIKERMDNGTVLVDYDDVFVVYDEGHEVEKFDDLSRAERLVNSLTSNFDNKFYYHPETSTATTWDEDTDITLNWKPIPKSDPRQTSFF